MAISKSVLSIRLVVSVTFVTALLILQARVNRELRAMDLAWIEDPDEVQHKLNPKLFEVMSFGQLPAAIDWLWLKTFQSTAIYHIAPGRHASVYFDYDLITDLDPLFLEAYVTGSHVLSIIRNDNLAAQDLLLKGRAVRDKLVRGMSEEFRQTHWGSDWQLDLILAYVYLYELGNLPKAAEAFTEAAQRSGSPAYLKSLRERLQKPGGQYEVGIRLINFLMQTSGDPNVKNELEQKRKSLFLGQYFYLINQNFKAFTESVLRHRKLTSLSEKEVQNYWMQFKKNQRVADRDPFGGKVYLDIKSGQVTSTTPRTTVLGLE